LAHFGIADDWVAPRVPGLVVVESQSPSRNHCLQCVSLRGANDPWFPAKMQIRSGAY
jgi:hypothetical protein